MSGLKMKSVPVALAGKTLSIPVSGLYRRTILRLKNCWMVYPNPLIPPQRGCLRHLTLVNCVATSLESFMRINNVISKSIVNVKLSSIGIVTVMLQRN